MPSCCREDGSYQAAFGLTSPLSCCSPFPKNALSIPSQRRGHLAAPSADPPWAKALHCGSSLEVWSSIHPGSAEKPRWAAGVPPRPAWLARWWEQGPCRGCSSPSYLPLPGSGVCEETYGWEGTRGRPWQAGNALARDLTGGPVAQQVCFAEVQLMAFPWFGIKGSFCRSQVKHNCFQEPRKGKDGKGCWVGSYNAVDQRKVTSPGCVVAAGST